MKNQKTVVALLIGILVIGGLIIWDARATKDEERAKKTEKLIYSFPAKDIMQISLVNKSDGKDLEMALIRSTVGWKLTKPFEAFADQEAIDQLVEAIQNLKYNQPIADTKDQWARYELDPAPIKISLLDSKGKIYSLSIGTKAQTGYDVYVGVGETGKVYTASYAVQQSMNKSVFNLRHKRLAQIDTGRIKELTYRSPEPFTAKFAMENNQLQMTSPQNLPTSQSDVMGFISDVNAFIALEIKDKPGEAFDKKFRESVARYEVSWTTEDNVTRHLEFGVVNGDLWATDNKGETYIKLERERDQRKLRKTLTDFRDKQIFSFAAEDVVSVTVDGKKTSELIGNARLLVGDLAELKAEDFMDTAPAGANATKPDHTVQVAFKKGQPIEMKVWKVGPSVYVQADNSKTIYKTSDLILNSLKI